MTIHDDLREVISELNRIIASMGIQEPDEPEPDLTINTKDLPFGATIDVWAQHHSNTVPKDAVVIGAIREGEYYTGFDLIMRVNKGG